jgi:hypothetical protein
MEMCVVEVVVMAKEIGTIRKFYIIRAKGNASFVRLSCAKSGERNAYNE